MAQRNCTSQDARVSVCIFHESRSSSPKGYKNSNLLHLPETLNTVVQIFPLHSIKAWVEENFFFKKDFFIDRLYTEITMENDTSV